MNELQHGIPASEYMVELRRRQMLEESSNVALVASYMVGKWVQLELW